jgi:hypothetical protein
MFFPFNYQLLDGTPKVDSNKLRQILHTVPGNEKLLKQEKGVRLMAYIFGTLCMASTVAHLGYLFSDYPDRDGMMTAFMLEKL